MTHVLSGVTVPVVTAMTPAGDPDVEAARPLLRALAAAGITNVMFFGTNGEGAMLNPHYSGDYLAELAPLWRKLAGPDAVVTATAFGAGTRETRNRARIFEDSAPDAIIVAPPYYFVHTDRELETYYASLEEVGIPIIAYNAPRYTGNPIGPDLLQRLAAMSHIAGVKDSGGDDELVRVGIRLGREYPRFGTSQGNERRMTWAIREGADGVTPGLGNLAPVGCLALVAAARADDTATADALQESLIALLSIHAVRGGVAAMKGALHLRGLSELHVAPPLLPVAGDELDHLRGVLRSWDGVLIE